VVMTTFFVNSPRYIVSEFDRFKYVNLFTRRQKLRRMIWAGTWLLLFRTTPRWALDGWRRQLLRWFGADVGKGCRIAPSCRIWAPWNLTLGDYTALGEGVDCYSMDKITIGSKVAVSQRSFLCAGSHRIDTLTRELVTRPIVIGNHAWVAAECFVHPGVEIGEGCVVGARAVVTKKLPPWTVCAGNPCRPLRARKLQSCDAQDLLDSADS